MPDLPNVNGGGLFGAVGPLDGSEFTVSSVQQQQQEEAAVPFTQVISGSAQRPLSDSSAEQFLRAGKPRHQPEHGDVASSEVSRDSSSSKMKKGCILSSSYPGGCVLPNGNGAAPPVVMVTSSEPLPRLPDQPPGSFYL